MDGLGIAAELSVSSKPLSDDLVRGHAKLKMLSGLLDFEQMQSFGEPERYIDLGDLPRHYCTGGRAWINKVGKQLWLARE